MTTPLSQLPLRRKTVWGPKRLLTALAILVLGFSSADIAAAGRNRSERRRQTRHLESALIARSGAPSRKVLDYKIDKELTRRKGQSPNARTKVIVTLKSGAQLPQEFKRFARNTRKLDLINGVELELPNRVLAQLEARPEIFRVHYDRPIAAHNYRTSVTVGANIARHNLNATGAGVGVAIIDSGITGWHNDLTRGNSTTAYPYGDQRVAKFVDFVSGQTWMYDDNGHGTHVAGIIAGNGYDSNGEKAGVAPRAHLVVLKVLDSKGNGSIGNVIAAMNWIATNASTYNIRVVNLSIGAKITESYFTDPLTLAAKRLADQGIVVVTAAGNFGKSNDNKQQYGSITAPGNAPWVLTVGATSTQGTTTRTDDILANFSSAGPTKIDYLAKPDLVAPGMGTVSLSVPGSTLFSTKSGSLSHGATAANVYLSLSGTSMAAPVVAGTVAAMFQVNPSLTPNMVKAILQYTAQPYNGYKPLQQGAGFLNGVGAVRLAKFYKQNVVGSAMPKQASWSRSVLWGNRLIKGGYLNPRGNAWANNVIWGAAKLSTGESVVWGTLDNNDNVVWGTADANGANVVWASNEDDNVVWGTTSGDNVVWGTGIDDNVVWGTSGDDDNVVWGTDCGGADCDNVVWGTSDGDNVVWGTSDPGDNVVWGTNGEDNVVWGTNGDDNVVWGSSDGNVPDTIYPDSVDAAPVDIEQELEQPAADLFQLVGGGL